MARPASDIAVCNLALDQIKEKVITTLTGDDRTKTEELCSRWYDTIRQATLQAYNWNFALFSKNIPRGGTPSVSDYTDYYVFPNDFLKLRAIIDPAIPLSKRTYEIQGRNLLYNYSSDEDDLEDTIPIWFTVDETDISIWPALFIRLMSEELAIVLGKKLTARPSIMKDIRTDLVETRRLARSMDGQSRPPKRYSSSRIVNAGLNPAHNKTVAGDYTFPDGMDD